MNTLTRRGLQAAVILGAYCLVMGTVAVTFAQDVGAWVPVSITGSASTSCGTKTGKVTVVNHEREDAIVLSGFLPAGTHVTPGTHVYSVPLPFSGNLVVRYPSDSTPRTSATVHLAKPAPCPTTTTTEKPTTTTTAPHHDTTTSTVCFTGLDGHSNCHHEDTTTTEPKTSTSVPTVSNDCDDQETAAVVSCVDVPQLAG